MKKFYGCLIVFIIFSLLHGKDGKDGIFPAGSLIEGDASFALSTSRLSFFHSANGNLYLGAYNKGSPPSDPVLLIIDKDLKLLKKTSMSVNCVDGDSLGNVWAAGYDSLFLLNGEEIKKIVPMPGVYITSIKITGETLIMGTKTGLKSYDSVNNVVDMGLDREIIDIEVSGQIIWAAGKDFVARQQEGDPWIIQEKNDPELRLMYISSSGDTLYREISRLKEMGGEILLLGNRSLILRHDGAEKWEDLSSGLTGELLSFFNVSVDDSGAWTSDASAILYYNIINKKLIKYQYSTNNMISPLYSSAVSASSSDESQFFATKNRVYRYSNDVTVIKNNPNLIFESKSGKVGNLFNLRGQRLPACTPGSFKNFPKGVYFTKLPNGKMKILHIK